MGIDALRGTSSTAPAGGTSGVVPGDGLGKEAFLKLLVAQLENQDPLAPVDGTVFVSQLATLSQVEQSLAQSAKLDLISLQLTGIASNEAVSLIGKSVTVHGTTIAFDGASASGFAVRLDGAAAHVTVTLRDASGNPVRTLELGAQSAGPLAVEWDGRDDAGKLVPAGSYKVEVAARDEQDSPVGVSQDVTGVVIGVSFEKGYPEIILASGATAPISDLVRVDEPPPVRR
ncbi:MAG: flagellar hook assembly protein FlgD [Myxococcales bacterium]|nr:flagellar hook assembly protein FlgD [Myxococcales bacterium]